MITSKSVSQSFARVGDDRRNRTRDLRFTSSQTSYPSLTHCDYSLNPLKSLGVVVHNCVPIYGLVASKSTVVTLTPLLLDKKQMIEAF